MGETRTARLFNSVRLAFAVVLSLTFAAMLCAGMPAWAHAAEITAADGVIDTQAELADAISQANAAEDDSIIRLGGDIEVTASGIAFNINNAKGKSITIDGDDGNGGRYSISGNIATSSSVSKMFAVYSDAAFTNVAIENSGAAGRCIDTREAIDLALSNVSLKAQGSGNTQPLTIGGSADGAALTLSGVDIDATPAGYGIIVFVKSDIVISQGSDITGYAALNMASGSAGSTVSVTDSALHGQNSFDGASSNYGTVAVRDSDITLDLVNSSITASTSNTDVQALFSVGGKGLSVSVEGSSSLSYTGNSRVFSYVSGFGATDVTLSISGGSFAIDDTFTEDMLKASLVDGASAGPLEDGSIVVVPAHECPSAGYTDVDQNAWYHEPVDFVVENGLMGLGTGDKFMPLEDASRAMFVTVLWRYAGEPSSDVEVRFPDVKAGAWYYDAVRWAVSAGVITGYSDGPDKGKFGPNDGVTREQMAVILNRFAKAQGDEAALQASAIDSFPDADKVSTWARGGMGWAVENGIITGVAGKYLAPADIAERSQVAAVIQRLDALTNG